MDTRHTEKPPTTGQRRTHAPAANDGYGLCGGKLDAAVATDVEPDAVTCLSCRARLRDLGELPMTPHAQARRNRR